MFSDILPAVALIAVMLAAVVVALCARSGAVQVTAAVVLIAVNAAMCAVSIHEELRAFAVLFAAASLVVAYITVVTVRPARAGRRASGGLPPVRRFRDDLTGYTITLEALNADEVGIVERLDGRYLRVVSTLPGVDYGFNRRAAARVARQLGAVLVDETGRSTSARHDAAAESILGDPDLHRPETRMVGGPDPDEPEVYTDCVLCAEEWPCSTAAAEGLDRVPVVLNSDGPTTDEAPF